MCMCMCMCMRMCMCGKRVRRWWRQNSPPPRLRDTAQRKTRAPASKIDTLPTRPRPVAAPGASAPSLFASGGRRTGRWDWEVEAEGPENGRLGAAAARDSTSSSTLISVSCSPVPAAVSTVGATACTDAFTSAGDSSKLAYVFGMAASVGGGGLSADHRRGGGGDGGDGGGGGGGSEAGGAQENTRASVWPTRDQCSTILNQSQPWSDPPQNPWRRSGYLRT